MPPPAEEIEEGLPPTLFENLKPFISASRRISERDTKSGSRASTHHAPAQKASAGASGMSALGNGSDHQMRRASAGADGGSASDGRVSPVRRLTKMLAGDGANAAGEPREHRQIPFQRKAIRSGAGIVSLRPSRLGGMHRKPAPGTTIVSRMAPPLQRMVSDCPLSNLMVHLALVCQHSSGAGYELPSRSFTGPSRWRIKGM